MTTTRATDDGAAVFNVKAEIFLSKYLLFAAVPFVFLMLYLSVLGTQNFIRAQQTMSWPSTVGTVTKVKIERGKDSRWATVEYTYDVDGKTHRSDRVSHNRNSTGYENATSFAEAHPEGSEIAVYYNPDEPEDALLIPGADVMAHLFLACPIFVALMAMSTIISALRYNGFVAIVAAGDLTSVKDACYKIAYGNTPMRALLAAAERPDDAILREVVKGSGQKEIESVMAYCEHMGLTDAYGKVAGLKPADTPDVAAMERKKNFKTMIKAMLWMVPILGWITYIVLTKIQ